MHYKEIITIRFVILMFLLVAGIVTGFLYNMTIPFKIHCNDQTESKSNPLDESSMSGFKLKEFTMPRFNNGIIKSEIRADEAYWEKGEPVKLKNPVVRDFSEDGKQVVAKMTGDNGELFLNVESKEMNSIRVWGNTKIIKYKIPEKKK